MRFLIRLLGGIWLATLVVSGGFAYLEVREERARQIEDLKRRAALVSSAVGEASERLVARGTRAGYERVLTRFGRPDRAIAIYDAYGSVLGATAEVRPYLGPVTPLITEAIQNNQTVSRFQTVGGRLMWVHVLPLQQDETPVGAAAVLLDAQYLDAGEWDLWRRTAVRIGVLMLLVTGITMALVRWSVTRPIARIAEWTKQLKAGHPVAPPPDADESLFGSLATEVTGLARTLARARHAAELEARLRLAGESVWTEERLKQFVEMRFGGRPMFVVSNREPISHVRDGRNVREQEPASGLVTALGPIMQACGGVWVAHGSGNADRLVGERIGLPSADPTYTLRRIWLTDEEEAGYYYGLANEGLWPLCHIVHERPLFRAGDWEQYRVVNERFARGVLEEMEKTDEPIVLVQDYHFALVPRLVKEARPDARVALFWHIPWPNFEAFGICPWQDEILLGMLGADLVGFHTQFYCNNFLETVERAIEGRIEWDRFTVVRGQHTTHVRSLPISVATDGLEASRLSQRPALLAELGVSAEFIGVGVERVDYTKGLPERFRAIRRFFERWPEYRRRVVFVQIASPSRTRIARYQALQEETREMVRAVNAEFGDRGWQPIVYRERHHDHREITRYYRAADFCMVTSLHDGMNLVAKEYVASRDDDDGVLVLSRFTGASHELRDALLVNPYDVEDMADAIRRAVTMDPEERRSRMRRMRAHVREHNIYGWAGMLLAELARIPQAAGRPTA
ncbi:MAG TPA: trehalose-6-phosphate synthase [Methylomirabilota bacterium]|jgi:trehalose 6-phosphate synthase|nr:trehalose-6-phosphate synthase [Methylomirabilota bacterium]